MITAVFNPNCRAGPAELRENYGFSRREIAQLESILTDHLNKLPIESKKQIGAPAGCRRTLQSQCPPITTPKRGGS